MLALRKVLCAQFLSWVAWVLPICISGLGRKKWVLFLVKRYSFFGNRFDSTSTVNTYRNPSVTAWHALNPILFEPLIILSFLQYSIKLSRLTAKYLAKNLSSTDWTRSSYVSLIGSFLVLVHDNLEQGFAIYVAIFSSRALYVMLKRGGRKKKRASLLK